MNISTKRRKELAAIPDSSVDESDFPVLGEDFWGDAEIVFPCAKKAISFRVDTDVLAWFKEGGKGYQTRMNTVLKKYMELRKLSS